MSTDRTTSESVHVPVLLQEIETAFAEASSSGRHDLNKGFWYLDGTLGGAGHAMALAKRFSQVAGGSGRALNIIGFDRDARAIARAQGSLKDIAGKLILECENYRNLDKALAAHDIASVDFILLDLGISSDELDASGKGFTFLKEEPLLMTMGDHSLYPFTAYDIINGWAEEDIANVIFGYGEDRYARRIARAIVAYREKKRIDTTTELAEIIKSAVPKQFPRFGRKQIHPATKTFQALRIAVNDELGALKDGLAKGYERLSPDGQIAVISFHSLEDRIVKEFFREKHRTDGVLILTKKPITATDQEIAENPRSRSAKLRILKKTHYTIRNQIN